MATRRADDALAEQGVPKMPASASLLTDAPNEAMLWVLRGGLTPERASNQYGMRWDEKTRRVLIPIPGGLLGRAVFNERPKYRMYTASPGALWWPQTRRRGALVVVEDILSAIAIDRAGWPSVAVLGTSISPVQAAEIAKGRDRIVGWFDGDAAGDKAFVALRQRLMPHPVDAQQLRTDRDPKCLHRADLRALLTQETGT